MRHRLKQAQGMTLVEVVISTAILGVVIMMTFMLSNSAVLSFEEKVATANLQTKAEETLKSMEDHIGDAQVLEPLDTLQNGISFYCSEVAFQVPVTHVIDPRKFSGPNPAYYTTIYPIFAPVTSQLRGTGGISKGPVPGDFFLMLSFGWRDDTRMVKDINGTQVPFEGPGLMMQQSDVPVSGVTLDSNKLTPNGYMAYRFVMDTNARIGQNGIFDEKVEQVDIDNDGLMTTQYAVGYIERSYWILPAGQSDVTSGGTLIPESTYVLGASNVLQPVIGDAVGKAPDKLKTNWIFNKIGGQLDVSLWLACYNQERRIQRVTHSHSTIVLRNSAN
jgi:prepilin-type N-terminal cleavage/methylation domain-containing protein